MGSEAAAVAATETPAPAAAAPAAAVADTAVAAAPAPAVAPPALSVVPVAAKVAAVAPAADSPEAKAAAETARSAKEAEAKVAESSRRAALSPEARAAEDSKAAVDAAAKLETEKTAKLEARRAQAPEKYKDFTPPEGVELAPAVMQEFTAVARDLGLTQEDAQALVDRLAPAVAKNHATTITNVARMASDEWLVKAAQDTEYGGEKFDENAAIAHKTFKLFGTPALEKFLRDSGMGNHPEIVRWGYRIGKLIGPDDKFIGGTEATAKPTTIEDRLWKD